MTTDTQLEIEYAAMPERHELYSKFGIGAEAAQLFETDVGTLLLCIEGIDSRWHITPDPEAGRKLLDGIDRSTLGQLLHKLKQRLQIEEDLQAAFAAGLKARNELMHGFFLRHGNSIQSPEGRATMMTELGQLHSAAFQAWRAATELLDLLSESLRQGKHHGS